MKIFYLKKFAKQYKKIPLEIKKLTKEKEKVFRINPFDSRLKTPKLHGDLRDFFAFSINGSIRIIFDFDKNKNVRFYTIGSHDIYY